MALLPKDLWRWIEPLVIQGLRRHAKGIAAWIDRQSTLPEPFEGMDAALIEKAILAIADALEAM